MRIAAHPGLYDPNEDLPTLHGVRCVQCSATFFPPFGIGCEVCGAPESELRVARLAAAGELYSVATVHHYAGKDIEAPFTMAEIHLDDGPLIRATLVDIVEPASIGTRVQGEWVPVGDDQSGDETVELRFSVVIA